jgi:hypothetical protein
VSKIKSAQATLNELRDGQVMNELAAAIHEATKAVKEHGKAATVTLDITVKPFQTKGLAESPITVLAEVSSKLPKPEVPSTLFYIDGDGNPTRQPTRQNDLPGVTVVGVGTAQGAA